jgi:hypothetical protein
MSTELTGLAALLEAHLTPLGFEHENPHKGRLHFDRFPEGFGWNDRLERITLEEIGLHEPLVYGCAKHGDHRGKPGHSFETMNYPGGLEQALSIVRELEGERQVALEAMKEQPMEDQMRSALVEAFDHVTDNTAKEAAEAAAVIAGLLSREDPGWCSVEGCDINVKDAIIDSAQAVARISVLGEGPWGNDSKTTYNEAMKAVADKIREITLVTDSEIDWDREVAEVFASMSQPQEGVSRTGGLS